MRLFNGIVSGLLALACGTAFAQSYSGTYTGQTGQGGTVTLTLKQDEKGGVSGALAGNGSSFQLKGSVKPEGLVGMITGKGGSVHFLGKLQGTQLRVVLAESGPGGQPNMRAGTELLMTRAGGK